MSFFDKLKFGLLRFMQGRYGGNDRLNRFLLYGAILLMICNLFLGIGFLRLLFWAMWAYALYRMFSRNHGARYRENQKFEQLWQSSRTSLRQFIVRAKNVKTVKYFSCPKCKARLKLPRGVGEVTVTCGKCGECFKKRA